MYQLKLHHTEIPRSFVIAYTQDELDFRVSMVHVCECNLFTQVKCKIQLTKRNLKITVVLNNAHVLDKAHAHGLKFMLRVHFVGKCLSK